MKTKTALITITAFLVFLFIGCGISQAEYDRVSAQSKASQAQVTELQRQINQLKEQNELVGKTATDTAANIVRHYHETHIYSSYDFFVCSDMALDVWDMVKAQGINAVIQIGNVETAAKDITEANHAWVLAEVSLGSYLALETTGGYAVWSKDNPLYYKGWSFDNPKEYKRFVELKQEYATLADIINGLISEAQKTSVQYENEQTQYQKLVNEFNMTYTGRPVSLEAFNFRDKMEAQLAVVKEIEGRCNQLVELIKEQTQKLENILSEMKGLLS